MKKIIKILPIILFIVLFLAITPSYVLAQEINFDTGGREPTHTGQDSGTYHVGDTFSRATATTNHNNSDTFCYDSELAVYSDETYTITDRMELVNTAETYLLAHMDLTSTGWGGTKDNTQGGLWAMGHGIGEQNAEYIAALEFADIVDRQKNVSFSTAGAKLSLGSYGKVLYGPITINAESGTLSNGDTWGGYTWSAEPAGAVELINYNGRQYLQIDITKLNGSKEVTFSVYTNETRVKVILYKATGKTQHPRQQMSMSEHEYLEDRAVECTPSGPPSYANVALVNKDGIYYQSCGSTEIPFSTEFHLTNYYVFEDGTKCEKGYGKHAYKYGNTIYSDRNAAINDAADDIYYEVYNSCLTSAWKMFSPINENGKLRCPGCQQILEEDWPSHKGSCLQLEIKIYNEAGELASEKAKQLAPSRITEGWSYTRYDYKYWNGREPRVGIEMQPFVFVDDTLIEIVHNLVGSIKIDLGVSIDGFVWLDGQTGLKPVVPPNTLMGKDEPKLAGIKVSLVPDNWPGPKTGAKDEIMVTYTDENGHYSFEDAYVGRYHIEFEYDGIHYESTVKDMPGGDSKGFERTNVRDTFNKRFQTIEYKKSNDNTTLNYNYNKNDRKSVLITTDDKGIVLPQFAMKSVALQIQEGQGTEILEDLHNINLGLVRRGTDIAVSTDVYDAEVSINGQKTTYQYNRNDNNIEIGTKQTSEEANYNLYLYASDYNYRIRDYVSDEKYTQKDYMNEEKPEGTTGDELNINVIYELNLQNQTEGPLYINRIKYQFDEKYSFNRDATENYNRNKGQITDVNISNEGNKLEIQFNNGLELTDGNTKTYYLVFTVNKDADGYVMIGDFSNKVELTSYSTEEGLIDDDSQPGNFIVEGETEDDNDTAGGLTITVPGGLIRKITGKVFAGDKNINDVIVQLIEKKVVNGKVYEYIWQETVAGSGTVRKTNLNGKEVTEYTNMYNPTEGYYEFTNFIPGDYIVRFIYGDGTAYDLTNNIITYNGQDYKSVADKNYNLEWYNASQYTAGESVARDNEARRLETMANYAEINDKKGLLLKLLNNITVNDLNETEKATMIKYYNSVYDPDITELTDDILETLLKDQTLATTWMCADTSKIKVAIETETGKDTGGETTVNGKTQNYVNVFNNVNLGLEKRAETEIELKKYITGFRLTTASGQTLVNASVDFKAYIQNPENIGNKIQGIIEDLGINPDGDWTYEAFQINLNTIVDGATLEFEYTIVLQNIGTEDYLSKNVENYYESHDDVQDYINFLNDECKAIKRITKEGRYSTVIGNYLGNKYYTGNVGSSDSQVKTEVTHIRDYVNNELKFVAGKTPQGEDIILDTSADKEHMILEEDKASLDSYNNHIYNTKSINLNTILKAGESGKLAIREGATYTVILEKNPLSATGIKSFDNYIAEVMVYTNAAGRRTKSTTPGNAEIVDTELRKGTTHEIDEAETAKVQITAATGEQKNVEYIWLASIAGGIAIIAVGAFVVKKYIIK